MEVLSDVHYLAKDGALTSEESKSTTSGANPLSDRSVQLWKSLRNWCEQAISDKLKAKSLRLVLYCSRAKPGQIASAFNAAKTASDCDAAIDAAQSALWGTSPEFPLRASLGSAVAEHIDAFFATDRAIQRSVISAFELEIAGNGSVAEARTRLAALAIPSDLLDDALKSMLGWVKSTTDTSIEQGKPAIVSYDDFHKELTSLIRKLDRRSILTSLTSPPTEAQIKTQTDRMYVRQLDLIQLSDDDKVAAITDYLRAESDRINWAERGWIHATSLAELEDSLKRTWKHLRTKVETHVPAHTDLQYGQSLYADCSLHNSKLQGLEVPPHFTPGSFHKLADKLVVGWHPNYIKQLSP